MTNSKLPHSSTKPLTIAIDIDEVLAQHNAGLAAFHNQHFGTAHTVNDYFSDIWSEVWGISPDEVERRVKKFFTPAVFGAFTPIPGAYTALQELRQHATLIVITVRRVSVVDSTHTWLQEHFPDTFDAVHFALNRWEPLPGAKDKWQICHENQVTHLIDDNIGHITKAANNDIAAILFGNYSWNQASDIPTEVIRIPDWPSVVAHFKELHVRNNGSDRE